jgi:hypothetical protein
MIALASLLLAAAPAPLAPAAQSPVNLFRAACLQGSVSLPQGSAAPIDYKALPFGARFVLGQTLAPPGGDRPVPRAPKAEDVPNRILAVGRGSAMFLIVPPGDQAATGSFAHSCAVVWKGEHFADARVAVVPDPSAPLAGQMPDLNPSGLASVGNRVDGLYLVATTLRGWTALTAAPSEPQSAPSGGH